MKTDLKQLSKAELTGFLEHLGQSPYRANQVINWLYKKLAVSFDEMTDLSKGLREG
ncbi:MAG TPA: 23S rRNA (adenine(2503)-C(2))-methyltransferase RlmN, partial [Nitrospirae bacterium]|nr:23S rRNA (adenine(2503)-C(2))-methyltransferase RlmN [Nitrospirota bacterium]